MYAILRHHKEVHVANVAAGSSLSYQKEVNTIKLNRINLS